MSFFYFFLLSVAKALTVKAFLEVTLVSLTLRVRTFNIFEKAEAISLYWFAAQQQTSTSRPEKFDLSYAKNSPRFNEFNFKL